tara:strand:- start:246 stop:707 length:462 start_codon:yes stop_codon:yes gene_type:complete
MSLAKPELERQEKEVIEIIEPPTPEELEILDMKEKAMKCKIIALESLGHNPLTNPTNMNKRDKKKVLDVMTKWFHTESLEDIQNEFNDIVCNKILNEKDDFTKLSVECGRIGQPELPPDMKVVDIGGNIVDVEEINKGIRETNDKILISTTPV